MKILNLVAAGLIALGAMGTQGFAQDKGTVGISMPTKSSARWIADGDNMVKVLQGARLQDRPAICRRRHPEPARPDREHGHQGRQGSGHRRDRRHDAVGRAAEGGRQGHQGHRL